MKKTVQEYSKIALGTLILSIGINCFLLPSKLSSGGVSSIGTVLLYLFKIPLSISNIFFNIILFAAGYKYLKKSSLIKTAAGIVFLSLFFEITSNFPAYTADTMISALAGGIIMGIGLGLVIRSDASTGGSDFAATILHKLLPHISIASFVMIIDCIIIAFAGLIFKSVTITFYSFIALFAATRVADGVLSFGDAAKSVYVLSHRSNEIADAVIKNIRRGVTGIHCTGMYSGNSRLMLLCVVSPKELPRLISCIRETDPSAFVIIGDTKEVLGEGFKTEIN